MTNCPCYKAGQKITVRGLMLHSVGCAQPNAEVFVRAFSSPSYTAASVHGFIDGNTGIVYQTLPWNHRAWHCGGSGNNTHIGVEMCEPATIKYTIGANFIVNDAANAKAVAKRTYDSAVLLFAMLCKQYGLNPLTQIVSHAEGYQRGIASGHADPEHLWRGLGLSYTMDGFRADVKKAMGGDTEPEPVPEPVDGDVYRVRKSWNDAKSQIGAFESLENAKSACRTGYHVYDSKGVEVYPDTKPEIVYKSHIQGIGWQDWKQDGAWSGTQGEGRRLEALVINPPEGVVLDVDVHLQKLGWRTYEGLEHGNDRILGTVGESRRMEAIRIRCAENNTGKKLWYQVHCQTYGTLPACAEGETAGTTGKAKRLEAIRICLE